MWSFLSVNWMCLWASITLLFFYLRKNQEVHILIFKRWHTQLIYISPGHSQKSRKNTDKNQTVMPLSVKARDMLNKLSCKPGVTGSQNWKGPSGYWSVPPSLNPVRQLMKFRLWHGDFSILMAKLSSENGKQELLSEWDCKVLDAYGWSHGFKRNKHCYKPLSGNPGLTVTNLYTALQGCIHRGIPHTPRCSTTQFRAQATAFRTLNTRLTALHWPPQFGELAVA